ncbi:MAG: hypothetical protein QW587_06345 [Candidatus Bathyarchaeia archaeon]
MSGEMGGDKRTLLILGALIAVALLAIFWATREPLGSPPERQGWGRWYLTDEQRREIAQLMKELTENGTSQEAIRAAVDAKLRVWRISPPPPGDIELFYTIQTVVSTINIALTIILLTIYMDIYRKTKSEFTIGLMIFSIVFLLYAFASNPIVHWAFGFRAFGLGAFAMLPNLFACVALSVLLYLSLKY